MTFACVRWYSDSGGGGAYLGRGLPGSFRVWPAMLELGGAGHTLTEILHRTNRQGHQCWCLFEVHVRSGMQAHVQTQINTHARTDGHKQKRKKKRQRFGKLDWKRQTVHLTFSFSKIWFYCFHEKKAFSELKTSACSAVWIHLELDGADGWQKAMPRVWKVTQRAHFSAVSERHRWHFHAHL